MPRSLLVTSEAAGNQEGDESGSHQPAATRPLLHRNERSLIVAPLIIVAATEVFMSPESLFKSTFRAFFRAFATILGIAVALFVVLIGMNLLSEHHPVSEKTTLIIEPDAQGNRALLPAKAPAVLKINIQGVIGSRELTAQRVKTQLLDSQTGALKNNRVKAIFLHINSPGGGVCDSFNIYKELIEYKKRYNVPIIAFVDGLCASGGMMIACAADHIHSNPVGAIGSVGVRMGPNFNLSQLMQNIGVAQKTLTRGKDKDALNPFRPWTPGEDASLEAIIAYDYALFIEIVTQARPRLKKEKLISDYGAQIFDPIKAQEYGYIDNANSSYQEALATLVKEAGIADDEPYQVVELRIQQPIFSEFVEGKSPLLSGTLHHKLELPQEGAAYQPLYLYTP